MSIYVIPTVPTFHIGSILEKNANETGLRVMYPMGHEKTNGGFYLPRGECYCRLPGIRELQGQDVEVIHSGYSRYPVNDGLEFLRQILSILREPRLADGNLLEGPKHMHLHLLSFPYGKQDGHWSDGENNRARQLTEEFLICCDSLTVIAPHFQTREWGKDFIDAHQVEYISPYDMLLDDIARDFPKEDLAFMSPGKFARFGDIDSPLIRTHRVEGLGVEIDDEIDPNFYGRKVVAVVDDLTLSGSTAIKFLFKLHQLKAKRKLLALPHIGTEEALKRLLNNGYDRIYTTNSCNIFSPEDYRNPKLSILDITPLLLTAIRREYELPVEQSL